MKKGRNKRLRKKGLSAVVTALVIILLVLVSTGTIWVAVKNLIIGGVEEISLGKFSTDLSIKSVKVEGETLSIGVERAVGKGDLVKLKFIFENGTDSEIIERETDIEELDEKSFIFGLGDLSLLNIKKVSIVPIYKSSSGKEVSGDIIDIFNLKKPIRGEAGAWEYIGNFARYGPVGIGRMEYGISSGEDKLPEFINIIVDPLDVHLGDEQTFIVYVTSPYEITEVTTITQLDNEILNLPLEKTENENEYMANWTVYDTHVTEYHTTFIARDSAGNENDITLTWTDPCTDYTDHGQTFTLDFDCQVSSGVDGIDAGNIIIASGSVLTMTGGTFIKTPGYTMTNLGTVAIGNGVLQKGYLYYIDADEDGHGSGYDWRSTSGTWAGHTIANSAVGDSDCSSNDADTYRNVGSLRWDYDKDGWTGDSAGTECVGGTTSVGGRTYYMDTSGGYGWLSSTPLGSSDCDDGNNAIWVSRLKDSDHDTYCPSATATCSNGAHPYDRTSCSGYTDCDDDNLNVYWSQNVGQDIDLDRYYTGTMAFRCVGVASGSWFRNAAGVNNWLASASALGSSDCDDTLSDRYATRTCYYDGDGDGYTVSSGTSRCKGASCASPADSYKALSSPTDCNDGSSSYWQQRTCYKDADNDGYTTGGSVSVCKGSACNSPTGHQASSTANDCYDSSSTANSNLVHPNQNNYYASPVGGSWWDYNCNGVNNKEPFSTYGACERCSSNAFYPNDETPEWESLQGEGGSSFEWIPLQPEGPEGECFDLGTGRVGWIGTAPACGVADVYYSNPGDCFIDDCPSEAYNCYWSAKTQKCR